MPMLRTLSLLATLLLFAAPALAQDFDRELGEQAYNNCSGCHQATGAGLPSVFPPLAGNTPNLVAAEGGKSYMIDVLLYGLQGEIAVNGAAYTGVMPAWGQLSDDQVAAVINHTLTAWENEALLPEGFVFVTADEVAAQRATAKTAQEMLEERGALELP
jgi:mono/diheme cytochrome c family protein